MTATVLSISSSQTHTFTKLGRSTIQLLAGLGVEGDAHCGEKVKHRSRVAQNPDQPNLRQVHLIHRELFDELAGLGYAIQPGDLGENILTQGIPLLELPRGTKLAIGASTVVEVTGLRNPCVQIERFRAGLQAAVLGRRPDGSLLRKAGIMGVVLESGEVRPGDAISVTLPPTPHHRLEPV